MPDAVGAAAGRVAVGGLAGRLPRGVDHARSARDVRGDDGDADDHARDRDEAGPGLADPPPRRGARSAAGHAAADLRGDGDRGAGDLLDLVLDHPRPVADARADALMPRFFDYYRQFEELAPEEVSAELRAKRDAEKARALTELPPLDLTSPAWHEPPHAEIVNAA